ncbi:MAG: methionyl-tRNA formyltransferase [Pseudomonadota bacterium]|nr:methionyl-tRNA formyltransferase [Pseudomonadota bacterium]
MRLGFAGTPEFAIASLDALLRSGHRVAAVLTRPDRPSGRGLSVNPSPVKRRALERGLEVYQPATLKGHDAELMLQRLELDALIVVAYGLILPPPVLAIPRLGCFNVHASLLPRWRGAAPIQRALLAGDAATGVTLMRMEAGLDTGPVLAAREVPIADRETAATLHDRLALLGGELLVETLDAAERGAAQERPQPTDGITYAHKIDKAEAVIDWRDDADGILRRVRAFNPWPVAETTFDAAQLRVWDAELAPAAEGYSAPGTVVAASSHGIDVACGSGALRILRLQLAGRKPLAAQEFIKAQRLVGGRFGNHE